MKAQDVGQQFEVMFSWFFLSFPPLIQAQTHEAGCAHTPQGCKMTRSVI